MQRVPRGGKGSINKDAIINGITKITVIGILDIILEEISGIVAVYPKMTMFKDKSREIAIAQCTLADLDKVFGALRHFTNSNTVARYETDGEVSSHVECFQFLGTDVISITRQLDTPSPFNLFIDIDRGFIDPDKFKTYHF